MFSFPNTNNMHSMNRSNSNSFSLNKKAQDQVPNLPPSIPLQNNNNIKNIPFQSINNNSNNNNQSSSAQKPPSHNFNNNFNNNFNVGNQENQNIGGQNQNQKYFLQNMQKQQQQQQQQQLLVGNTGAGNLSKNGNQDLEKIRGEYKILTQKYEYLENKIENSKQFESTKDLIDLKSFIKQNYKQFSDLIDQLFSEKNKVDNLTQKNTQLQQELLSQTQDTISNNNQVQQSKNNNPEQHNANQQFYLNKIKELEEKNQSLNKENEDFKHKNKQLREQVKQKDFFREYDLMVKEVEGLRRQNMALSEKIKAANAKK